MKKLFKYKHFNFALVVVAWGIVLFFPFLVFNPGDGYKVGSIPGLYFTYSGIVHIVVFYLNALFLYPKLLNRIYWILYIVAVVLLIFLSYLLKLHILITCFPNSSADARAHVLFPSVAVFIASLFYSITVDKIRTEKMQNENKAIQLALELKFLRSQTNPHFVFNVLTNLVALARKKSDQLEISLLMLSRLMRYMLYGADKKISVQQEIEYLESYIALQKLRFENDIKIVFSVALSPEELSHSIEPMLLMPFVENSFKHGINSVEQPFVLISLTVSNGELAFQVKNKFAQQKEAGKEESSGIGLSNVHSRLNLLYAGRHNLRIDEGNDMYVIDLTLNL